MNWIKLVVSHNINKQSLDLKLRRYIRQDKYSIRGPYSERIQRVDEKPKLYTKVQQNTWETQKTWKFVWHGVGNGIQICQMKSIAEWFMLENPWESEDQQWNWRVIGMMNKDEIGIGDQRNENRNRRWSTEALNTRTDLVANLSASRAISKATHFFLSLTFRMYEYL